MTLNASKNIFQGEGLREQTTAKDFLAVKPNGNHRVRRNLKHYNLEQSFQWVIASVSNAPYCLASGPRSLANLSIGRSQTLQLADTHVYD